MNETTKGKRGLKFFLMLFVPLVIGVVCITGFLQAIGAVDLMDCFGGAALDPWPAYDPDYRLDVQDGPLTEEQIALFIATKIPDEQKDGLKKIRLIDEYECVLLGPAPEYSDELNEYGYPVQSAYNSRPYENSVVLEDGFTGLEIKVIYEQYALGGNDQYPLEIISSIQQGFEEASDYVLVNIAVLNCSSDNTNFVEKSDYERYFPDYTIQSPAQK